MTPESFVAKWSKSELKERSACQEHFLDLCHLVGHPTPAEADPTGESFCFERFAEKQGGTDGFADVWKKGFFAIEYKGKRKDLGAAYEQLLRYREDLENPPLLAVCDTDRLVIHTNFTNTAKRTYELNVANLADPGSLELLRALFNAPEKLRPGATIAFVSEEAARKVAALAQSLEARGIEPMQAARFLMKLVFALFAEDADLLPEKLVEDLLTKARLKPALARPMLEKLFMAMRDGDEGLAFTHEIAHFNGGLFEDPSALDLEPADLDTLKAAAGLDWSSVDPAIFGNLYEYGLGADSRSKRGVHYTSREDILHLIEPVLLRPWRGRWAALKAEVEAKLATKPSKAVLVALQRRVEAFRESLGTIQILDPACGSGNFLVVAMQRLLDLELEVVRFQAVRFHTQALSFHVGPQQLHGIEILAFPHALASVVVWIGHLQWLRLHGYRIQERPILKKLQPIVHGDSLVLDWPEVDAIIGNPPFIGSKRLRSAIGDDAVDSLFRTWAGRVPHEADYVCYWFEKARMSVVAGRAKRVGLLATNGIRQGKNRIVLDHILRDSRLFFAESNRDWILEGAAVRVSMVGFGGMESGEPLMLDGEVVSTINADLTSGLDLKLARNIPENLKLSFIGDQKSGPFEVEGHLASSWLMAPQNPNGRSNSDVLHPWVNGQDLVGRPRGRWIIDFGLPLSRGAKPIPGMLHLSEADASYFEAPFNHALNLVKPMRTAASQTTSGTTALRKPWFVHGEPRPAMRAAIAKIPRYLATPRVSKHRIFTWLPSHVISDCRLLVVATDQDQIFGILQSRIHDLWSFAACGWHGVGDDPQYGSAVFETYPFPAGCWVKPPSAISDIAHRLNKEREDWLNPEGADEATLKQRTLTALYNEREAGRVVWLNNLHRDLDRAVLAAYGWSDLAEALFAAEDALRAANPQGDALGLALGRTEAGQAILGRLLALNQKQSAATQKTVAGG
ncbi:MAG TPA: DNA methyltransferase [Geothrix sp.]|nr:DNA methyltransferase [Geothrix sp.]